MLLNNTVIEKPVLTKEEYEDILKNLEQKKTMILFKRIFDVIISFFIIVFLSPLLLTLSILIVIDSGMPIIFKQERMGKQGRTFTILKFRTMENNSTTIDGITLLRDKRVTRIGYFLRKYRLDELPQLFNILKGDMSFVGPRPDLSRYYSLNDYAHKCILLVRPGVTCESTLKFKDEDKMLSMSAEPEKTYVEEVFPQKIRLNIEYIKNMSILSDIKIIVRTVIEVFVKNK